MTASTKFNDFKEGIVNNKLRNLPYSDLIFLLKENTLKYIDVF